MNHNFSTKNLVSQSPLEKSFDWRCCWYPVTFVKDFPKNQPYKFSLYDEPLVLFRNDKGELGCLLDRCSHRAAKLSDGQILSGRIECLYHGWQFGIDGKCLHIPQLPQEAKIPKNACIISYPVVERQGIIWIWGSPIQPPDEKTIPTVGVLETDSLFLVDTVTNLPFGQTFLVENFLDPAHVSISHDRTELKMKRENAQPLEMEVISVSSQGIKGRYRGSKNSLAPWFNVEFIAPLLVAYDFSIETLGIKAGFALYAMPLGKNRSRVFVRRYSNRFSAWFKLKPRWLEHLRQNKLLEEDLFYIVEQSTYIEQSSQTIKEVYLPLKTADVFVIEHRKWLDQYGSNLPVYDGYVNSNRSQAIQIEQMPLDRFYRHTSLCQSCLGAYKTTQRLKQILMGGATALFSLAVVSGDGSVLQRISVFGAILAIIAATSLRTLKTHFELMYVKK